MTRLLRALAALLEDLSSVLSTEIRSQVRLLRPVPPAPKNQVSSLGFCDNTHIHTQKKIKRKKK